MSEGTKMFITFLIVVSTIIMIAKILSESSALI